ncbi:MAG: sensor histidine kinase [Chitinophagales bacterium]
MQDSLPVRFAIGALLLGLMIIFSVLWNELQKEKEIDQRKEEAEKLSRDAELFKLRQQLQPHFLFNSLNSINALIGSRPQEAKEMVQKLSEFLRGTLRKDDQQRVKLEEELHHLQLYLDIEKVRFGHRLITEINCEPDAMKMDMPALLLQPIVENAIKFGLYDTTDAVTIQIRAAAQNQQLIITVQNPFDPETSAPNKGTGFGLASVQRRLSLLFGRSDLLETSAVEKVFTTTVKIPQRTT